VKTPLSVVAGFGNFTVPKPTYTFMITNFLTGKPNNLSILRRFKSIWVIGLASTFYMGCTKAESTEALKATAAESSAKAVQHTNGKQLGTSDCGCRDIKVRDIPGFSIRNRYFTTADIEVSVMLTPAGLNLFIIGGYIPDTFPMDSVAKDCGGKYTLTFLPGVPAHPDSTVIKIEPRKLTFLADFLGMEGTYNLLFDFSDNHRTRFVSNQDAGIWYVYGLAPFRQKLKINRDLTLDFQSSNDSTILDKYRIVRIDEDRPDDATLYYVVITGASGQSQFSQVLVKHFGTLPMVMLNFIGTPIETTPLYYLSR
jgi:hypothetical protein